MYESWGRNPQTHSEIRRVYWRTEPIKIEGSSTLLPYGKGRSYGDSCLNDLGILIDTAGLNRFINFDHQKGTLRCEAGVTLEEILDLIVPQGWFLPVTPGTKFVTVGGAIANDVHGKNQHKAGTFGCHVLQFELLRSDGDRLICSREENTSLFRATIGGLGLTGLILWSEIQLKPIRTPFIIMENIKFKTIDEFLELSINSERNYEYIVSWIDCISRKSERGLFIRGNHNPDEFYINRKPIPKTKMAVPFDLPGFFLQRATVKIFNFFYYHHQFSKNIRKIVHYDPFFYPLDAISNWNRIYGKKGFFQYQCVVPDGKILKTVLGKIRDSGEGSFLSILKTFGDVQSPGLLSFPRKGVTLALDFPNRGRKTLDLLNQLDDIVGSNGGAVYPAKDARMSPESFNIYYPQWREFTKFIDPKFSSSFWRRVTGATNGFSYL